LRFAALTATYDSAVCRADRGVRVVAHLA